MSGASLISDDDELWLMALFLYFTEQTHFKHLRDTAHPDYTWDEYYHDLLRGGEL